MFNLPQGVSIASMPRISRRLGAGYTRSMAQNINVMPVSGGGFRVRPGRDARLFAELGLQVNDVVTAVNGQPLDSEEAARALFSDVLTRGEVAITVNRQGQELTLAARPRTSHGETPEPMNQRLICLLFAIALAFPLKADDELVLNFKDADIRSLITAVADMTGRNIIVDPQVTGRVTVISSQPMAADEVWEVFLSILRVHGYSAIADERVVRIVPDATARQDGRVPVDDMRGGGDDPITRIIPLEHVRASEVSTLLRSLMPQSAHMVHHDASNSLVISDRSANVRRIENIVRRLDSATDHDIEVITLEPCRCRRGGGPARPPVRRRHAPGGGCR
jgi:hypothetical protein